MRFKLLPATAITSLAGFTNLAFSKNCLSGNGADYSGTLSTTESGFQCQNWLSGRPHYPNNRIRLELYKNKATMNHNYCRNVGQALEKPWCYTTNRNKRFDYCSIPECGNPQNCLEGIGKLYQGQKSTSKSGQVCLNWQTVKSNRDSFATRLIPSNANHNFCRNFDNDKGGPWCYTDLDGSYEFCEIEKCSDSENNENDNSFDNSSNDDLDGSTNNPDDHDSITDIWSDPSACGYKNNDQSKQSRIVGGLLSDKGEWPWQAHLRKYGQGFCGGSIINNRWILTAAHCADSKTVPYPSELNIAVGWNYHAGSSYSSKLTAQDRAKGKDYIGVSRIIVHPAWKGQESNDLRFDIALIELVRPIKFVKNGLTRPVCLSSPAWDNKQRLDNECTATGWGANEDVGDPSSSATLKELDSKLLEVELDAVNSASYNDPGQIGGKAPSWYRAGVCFGDSGGPFVCTGKKDSRKISSKRHAQVGLSSYVRIGAYYDRSTGRRHWAHCGNDKPSMFTKVSYYLDWIKMYAREVQYLDGHGEVRRT